MNSRVGSGLFTKHGQGLRARGDRTVAETIGLAEDEDLAGLLRLGRRALGKSCLDLLDDIRLDLSCKLAAAEDRKQDK